MGNRLRSFTLSELLVAMAVSAVVVTLALGILSLFKRNMGLIGENYAGKTKLSLLEQQLSVDVERYPSKWVMEKGDAMLLKSPLDSVEYRFLPGALLRQTDTLYIGKYEKQFLYMGEVTQKGRWDALKMEFYPTERDTSLIFVYWSVDSKTLLGDHGNQD